MTSWFQRLALGAAGLIALGVGLAILTDPATFYAHYELRIGSNVDLLSELRAPGANLAALGALISAGALHSAWTRMSALLGAIVFLAFAFGRALSMALDGLPSDGLIAAAVIEIGVGGLCLAALPHRDGRSTASLAPRASH